MISWKDTLYFSIGILGIVFLMVKCGPGINLPGSLSVTRPYRQILIGAPDFLAGSSRGKMYNFSGETGYLKFSKVGEANSDNFGDSVSSAGDFNGDGFDDIIVGASNGGAGGQGKIYVYSGKDQTELFSKDGETPSDSFGTSVSSAGDFNGDGFDDIIVGANGFNGAGTNRGKVYVYSGSDQSELFSMVGNDFDNLGFSVSTAGDFNGDGFDDIVLGAFGFEGAGTNRGKVYVYAGPDGSTLLFSKEGDTDSDYVGRSVSSAGDFNGDGYDDIVVGATELGVGGEGKVYVYGGNPSGSTLLLFSTDGQFNNDRFGEVVSTAGDFNGDGFDDIVVGAPLFDGGGTNRGKVYVYSGQDGSELFSIVGTNDNDGVGGSVSSAGDFNRDGKDDIVVGAANFGLDRGKVYVLSGPDGSELFSHEGELDFDQFGFIGVPFLRKQFSRILT